MFTKSLLVFAAILFIAIPSYAAPSVSGVSGTLSDGSSVTISGSGFGSKATAKPVIWDTFEGGADGSADVGSWSTFTAGQSSTARRGSKSAQAGCGGTGVNQDLMTGINMGLGQKVFVSIWRRYNFDFNSTSQMKILRYYPDAGGSLIVGYQSPYLINYVENCENGQWYDANLRPTPNAWYNEMFLIKDATAKGTSNGVLTYNRWDDKGAGGNLFTRTNVPFQASGQGNFNRLYLTNYGIQVPSGSYAYYDDVYIDSTWARVMIGNNANFASCTKFEMEIPTVWSSAGNSITVTFNNGNFASGSTAYLFVVDENNNASPGYKITLGGTSSGGGSGGSGTTPPPAPTNLHVVQ